MHPANASAYVVRADALSPAKTYRLTPEGLAIAEDDAAPRVLRWQEIVAVDLAYAATRYAHNRHVFTLQLRNGAREQIVSCGYAGFAKFRDQAAAFNAFVRDLHAMIATRGEGVVRFGRDESPWAHRARQAVAAGLVLAVLGLAIIASLQGFARGWVLVKLLVVAAMVPALLRWVHRGRGGSYDPLAIPADRLPTEPDSPAPQAAPKTTQPSSLSWRLVVTGLLLWLVWIEWRTEARPWSADLARPQTVEELRGLTAGEEFLLSGRVEPLPAMLPREWQGRFVFRHRQRQDQSGGSGGKTIRVVTVAEHRPALLWVWDGGAWELPADSYGIEHAPQIEPRFWPRKWLWTTRVDDWDASSTGFRAGEAALALGRVAPDGTPMIVELLPGSLERADAQWRAAERPRQGLVITVKLALTLGLLLWVWRGATR